MTTNFSINNLPVNIQNVLKSLSSSFYSIPFNSSDPIERLSVNDIIHLQSYLENVKNEKIKHIQKILLKDYQTRNVNNNYYMLNPNIENNETVSTRKGKKIQENFMNQVPNYYNPYEYDSKQILFPPQYRSQYLDEYYNDPDIMQTIGVKGDHVVGNRKDVNIETGLLHSENSRVCGKNNKLLTDQIDRFDYLPFDAQDPSHIVWNDDMPRGGYATRNNKGQYRNQYSSYN